MSRGNSDDPTHWQREHERARLREKERKDLEVERNRGPRPLEGLSSGGHTTWTGQQDDSVAAEVHGHDAADAEAASEAQVRRQAQLPTQPPSRARPPRRAARTAHRGTSRRAPAHGVKRHGEGARPAPAALRSGRCSRSIRRPPVARAPRP